MGDEPPTAPGWMASLDDLSGRRALVTGLALAGINPKNIALTLAAVTAVGGVGLDDRDRAVAMAVYVGLGSVTVVGAVAAHLAVGDRAAAPLAAAKRFMIHNNTLIIIAVLVLLAVMIGGEGVAHLRR